MATTSYHNSLAHSSFPPPSFPSVRSASPRWPAFFLAWLPVLLFACVFAIESTAAFGANRTSAPLHTMLHSIFGSAIDPSWSEIHHLLRKTGHFLAYGTFSLVCLHGLTRTSQIACLHLKTLLPCQTLAVAITFLAASADEIHQTFLPNRTGCFSDVLLDTAGAITLQLGLAAVLHFRLRSRRIRKPRQGINRQLPLAA